MSELISKQEVINEIEKIDYQNLKYDSPERMLSEQKQLIIDIIERLDKLQKVKVPQFVAEWIETAKKEKRTLHYSMQDIDDACYYHKGDDPLYRWMFVCDDSSEHQEIFAHAWLDGYEVEEEPKWIVCYSTMYLKSPLETGQIESVEITPKKELAYHFKSYKEAKQQTSLIGGTVEKV